MVNDHTEAGRIGEVLARLARGERVAVVTDAGTPGISDPGERLVRAATAQGFTVEVVPGPSAAIAALVASGLPTGRFVFEGFLPRKGSGRTQRLALLASETRTIVLYEAPHRLARTLGRSRWTRSVPQRRVAVARELTKLHEEVVRGTLADAVAWASRATPRGASTCSSSTGTPRPTAASDDEVLSAVREALARGLSARDAASEVARTLGVPKRRAYSLATAASH